MDSGVFNAGNVNYVAFHGITATSAICWGWILKEWELV